MALSHLLENGFQSEARLKTTVGIFQPVATGYIPNDWLLTIENRLEIKIVDFSPIKTSVYIDLVDIESDAECGGQITSFDPSFHQSGGFYIYFNSMPEQTTKKARFSHRENDVILANAGDLLANAGDLNAESETWRDTDGHLARCHCRDGRDLWLHSKPWLITSEKFSKTARAKAGNQDPFELPEKPFGLTFDAANGSAYFEITDASEQGVQRAISSEDICAARAAIEVSPEKAERSECVEFQGKPVMRDHTSLQKTKLDIDRNKDQLAANAYRVQPADILDSGHENSCPWVPRNARSDIIAPQHLQQRRSTKFVIAATERCTTKQRRLFPHCRLRIVHKSSTPDVISRPTNIEKSSPPRHRKSQNEHSTVA
ncbi:MAG: hypothetical protein AAGJ84_15630 [Pseudomonadota bacterium]